MFLEHSKKIFLSSILSNNLNSLFQTFLKTIQKPLKFNIKKFENSKKLPFFETKPSNSTHVLETKQKTALIERFGISGRGDNE